MDKKWSKTDIAILVFQLVAPITGVVVTVLIPEGQALSADVKLAIVSTGIVIPVILLQISLTIGQNKNESDTEQLKTTIERTEYQSELRIADISSKLDHISPVLEQVFVSGNERAKRFVYRRMDEVTKVIRTALSNNNSGNLRPSEYYEELLYLADLIIKDQAELKENFKGEVWAMTSFADEEWIEDEGYEKLWTERMTDIVDRGIKTRRLCILPDRIYQLISINPFSESAANSVKSFKGFINYLENYYGKLSRKKFAEHYCIRTNENLELARIKGFFAIMLSNGEMHILHGETVNENGALTAKVLFDPSEILRVRRLFELYARPSCGLSKVISEIAGENGFLKYLTQIGVDL